MSKKPLILGIESSCDETAASLITENEEGMPIVLSNIISSQVDIHKEFGGVVPELAARSHIEEIDWIVTNPKRNEIIKNLTIAQTGNTLVLFQFVEKHGKIIFEMLEKECKDRKVFFVFGGTDTEIREEIRALTEKENDAIIVASYGTFSTGINIRNLHNIVFASPSKSKGTWC